MMMQQSLNPIFTITTLTKDFKNSSTDTLDNLFDIDMH